MLNTDATENLPATMITATVLGYGLARLGTSACRELQGALFARVTQTGNDVFENFCKMIILFLFMRCTKKCPRSIFKITCIRFKISFRTRNRSFIKNFRQG